MADPVFLITGASSGIGEATARHAAEAGYRLVLAARSEDKLDRPRRGARRHERASPCAATSPNGRTSSGWPPPRSMPSASIDVVFGERRLRRAARLPRVDRRALARDGAHERLRRRAHDPGHPAALRESKGHLLLTGSVAGRRALPGSLYSCTKWAVTAMGEAAAPGGRRQRRPRAR